MVKHLLLIESDSKVRPVFVKMLLSAGYAVDVACDWDSGVARAAEDFDLVVLDFHGDITANGVVAMISQLRARRRVQVIVLTSAQDCRKLRNRSLAPGIRAAPRMALLEEARYLTGRSFTPGDTAARDQLRAEAGVIHPRQPLPLNLRSPSSTAGYAHGSSHGTIYRSTDQVGSNDDETTAGMDGDLSQLVADETLAPGTVIDKYRIEELVGKGGFAHVYRATHLVLAMPCALKVLKRSLAESHPDVVEGFCTEARNAIRISHPNVVRVHDVTRGGPVTYLVMEWIEGLTLSDVLTSTVSLPANDVLRIGIAVCAGLEAALAHGTIHRDVKPGNILLANDGAVKLVDFGLAKNVRNRALSKGDLQAERIVGTPAYMSPEQAFAPDAVDSRSDMYSLGATLFHACAGRPPYQGDDPLQLLLQHRDEEVPDLGRFADDCSPEFAGLITRMLAKDKADRFSSLPKLRALMQELLDAMIADGTDRSNGWSNVYLRKNTAATQR